MTKETKSLVMVFLDEGAKQKTITIREPQEGIVATDVKRVADNITQNKLVFGKLGLLKTYQGAFIVTRSQEVIA